VNGLSTGGRVDVRGRAREVLPRCESPSLLRSSSGVMPCATWVCFHMPYVSLQSKLAEMAKKLAEMSRQLDEARREQQDVRKLNEVYTQRIIEAHATCNRQPATCSRQSAACDMQRAACSTHHTACSRQRCNMQHAADNVATCSRRQIARHALHEGSLTHAATSPVPQYTFSGHCCVRRYSPAPAQPIDACGR
jgi:hypothetical protein